MRILVVPALVGAAVLLAAASSATVLRPGLWEEQVRITGATLAGAAAPMPLPAPTVRRMCIGTGEAADLAGYFAAKGGGDCSTDRSRVGSGRIDMAGVCRDRSGATATTATAGRYDADDYAMDVSTTMLQSARALVVRSQVVANRIGDCPASG